MGVAGPDFDGDVDDAPLWAGESCTVVSDIKPAALIVRNLVAGAEAAGRAGPGLLPGPIVDLRRSAGKDIKQTCHRRNVTREPRWTPSRVST